MTDWGDFSVIGHGSHLKVEAEEAIAAFHTLKGFCDAHGTCGQEVVQTLREVEHLFKDVVSEIRAFREALE